MPRVKRGKTHLARRRNLLKKTKGFMWGRKSKIKLAKTAVLKSGKNAFRGRKEKKRNMRGLWQTQISAAVVPLGTSYSRFMGDLKKAGSTLDRKVLSGIANNYPEAFKALVESARKK